MPIIGDSNPWWQNTGDGKVMVTAADDGGDDDDDDNDDFFRLELGLREKSWHGPRARSVGHTVMGVLPTKVQSS